MFPKGARNVDNYGQKRIEIMKNDILGSFPNSVRFFLSNILSTAIRNLLSCDRLV
jgi:hypothetical protein